MADQNQVQSGGDSRANALIQVYKTKKGLRSNFESYWQSLHDYFYIEADDINKAYYPGSELNVTALFDSTTLESGDVLAAGFMNYLTPPTSKWFALKSRNPDYSKNHRVTAYFEDVVDIVNDTLNRSNFYNQIIASYKSSGIYGTSAMLEEEDIDDDVRFYSLPIKSVILVEDGRGVVVGYYIEFEFTVEQAEDKWGKDKLSQDMQESLQQDKNLEKKYPFLLYIAKRHKRDVTKSNKSNMPIEATWVDITARHIVDEGGYHEMPAMCHRFDKRPFIPWGFSPAMKALPFARILNAIAKTNLRTMMKQTDPPIALPDNAFILPFNGNPRAVNYYDKSKIDGKGDIFSFGNEGNPQVGLNAIEFYQGKVKALMYNDVFLAFDGITKQMQNPEVMERINEKMTMLGPAVGRYIAEMLNPVIIRTIGILDRAGKLPPRPQELVDDPNYEIDCISQLAQSQRRSELNSLITGLTLVGQMSAFSQDVMDKIDPDKVVDEAWEILGAPTRVMRDDDEIAKLRDARGKAAQAAQKLSLMQQGADVVQKGSQVDLNVAKAKQAQPAGAPPVGISAQ